MPRGLGACSSLNELDLRDNPNLAGVPNYLLRDDAVSGKLLPCTCYYIVETEKPV